MAGGLRLGFGYTLLILGVIVLFIGAVLSGISFEASGEGQDCDSGFMGMGDCESGEGSVSFDGVGSFVMIPGALLMLIAAPLIVFGHVARSDEEKRRRQEARQGGTS